MCCSGVTKYHGAVTAVEDVDFELVPGEILSILGPSGCGKTSLLRLIAGFDNLDGGQIFISGKLASSKSTNLAPDRRNLGMVFQEYALFPHMTVKQNVSFGLKSMPKSEREGRFDEVMELVRLTGMEARYPHELSGGQQQRVALARTIAPRPVIILLDEPFSNLDTDMRLEMRGEVERILRSNNIATVLVTHDRDEAFAMADRVGIMREGRLEQIDTPDNLYSTPASTFVARFCRTCDFLKGREMNGVIVTEIGNLPFSSGAGAIEEGSEVSLMVQPDDFRVIKDPNGASVIETREFRGGETMLLVRMPSGAKLNCRQLIASNLVPGDRVTLIPASDSPMKAFLASVDDSLEAGHGK